MRVRSPVDIDSRGHMNAIILAGHHDFGLCALTGKLQMALWPVDGKPAIEHLLDHLADQGVRQVTICTNHDSTDLSGSIQTDNRLQVKFSKDELPAGTAGCIRNAAGDSTDSPLLVFPANITNPPPIDIILDAHSNGGADLTVMLEPVCGENEPGQRMSGVFVLNSSILKLIPKAGYFDLKEGLIAEMVRMGKSIHAATLPYSIGKFRSWREYISAMGDYLECKSGRNMDIEPSRQGSPCTTLVADNAEIDSTVRLCGSVRILSGAKVAGGAVIIGPTVLGHDVVVGEDSLVSRSVIWDRAKIGHRAQISGCVLDYGTTVCDWEVVRDQAVSAGVKSVVETIRLKTRQTMAAIAKAKTKRQHAKLRASTPEAVNCEQRSIRLRLGYLPGALVLVAFLYCCWPNIIDLMHVWRSSDEYSSGLLVPFLAAYALWARRDDLLKYPRKPSLRWGLSALVFAQALRFLGLLFMYGSAERLSIILTVAALVLLLFGWEFSKRVSTVLLFLLLMAPLPNRVQLAIAQPLQDWATRSAVFMLEILSYEAVREGNIINIGDTSVAVAEACNGLRMITSFFVIGGLIVLLVKRAWWEKLIVLASCLPTALLCNTIRLTVTSIALTVLKGDDWKQIFHDFGGYAMMPLALLAVVGELWLLKQLTTTPENRDVVVIERHKG